jgi:hypothetical protein
MSAQTASQTLTQVMPSGPTIAADASLCAAGKTLVVLPAQQTESALLATQGRVQSLALNALPAEVRRACGVAVERHQIGTPDGSVALDLGPRTSSLASPTRFVSLIDAQGTHALNPPIRIDRRFALMGQFNPSSGQFVVSPGARPAALQTIADRTWAKTNCGKFWLVDAATRRVASGCIPFGAYADETGDATVVPLPSRAGLFFAVPERGLYRVVDDTAKQVVAAPVDQARLGPDGCSLAFIGSASKTAQGRQVMVLNVCKLTP